MAPLAILFLFMAINPARLAGLPRTTVTVEEDGRKKVCSGPLLVDVINPVRARAGLKIPPAAPGIEFVVEGRGKSGARFSMGELQAPAGKLKAIVADRCDGRPLSDADGAYRVVVEGDRIPARSVPGARLISFVGF